MTSKNWQAGKLTVPKEYQSTMPSSFPASYSLQQATKSHTTTRLTLVFCRVLPTMIANSCKIPHRNHRQTSSNNCLPLAWILRPSSWPFWFSLLTNLPTGKLWTKSKATFCKTLVWILDFFRFLARISSLATPLYGAFSTNSTATLCHMVRFF